MDDEIIEIGVEDDEIIEIEVEEDEQVSLDSSDVIVNAVSPRAKVSKAGNEATIIITDVDGTSTAVLYDGQDGQDGTDGEDGIDGNGIESVTLNDDYTLTIALTDGDSYTTPSIRGESGSPGAAATVSVGTVTTGAAGTNASVTNTGTSSAAVFDFVIPRGDSGKTFIATYGVTTYEEIEAAYESGSIMVCEKDGVILQFSRKHTNNYYFRGFNSISGATQCFIQSDDTWVTGTIYYVPSSRTVNGKSLSNDVSLTASDVGALPDNTAIPSATSDLVNDSGFITLSDLPIYDGTVV